MPAVGVGIGPGWRRGGRASPWSPARLFANGEAGGWWDPSDLSTVWQDASRTIPGAVDAPVGCQDDKSGRDNHLKQFIAANRPMLRQSGGLTWLEGDGINDTMLAPSLLKIATGRAIVLGWQNATNGSGTSINLALLGIGTGNNYFKIGTRRQSGVYHLAATCRLIEDGVGPVTAGNLTFSPGASFAAYAELANDLIVIAKPGQELTAAAALLGNDTASFETGQLFVNDGAVQHFYGGVILDRAMTLAERTAALAHFGARAGA